MSGADKNTNKLPAVPEVLLELVAACRGKRFDLEHITSIVQHDPSLVARLLHLQNPGPGLVRLDEAGLAALISELGAEVLGSIASAAAVNQFYSRFWPGRDQHHRLWSRSLECACLARTLARATGYSDPDEAYLAGLLHNLGQHCLLAESPQQYAPALEGEETEEQRLAFEKERFGSTSVEIGASRTQDWTREALLSDAILFQHSPTGMVLDSPEIVRLVNLSCKLMVAEPWENKTLFEDALQSFSLSAGQLLEVRSQARSEQHEIISHYGLLVDEQGNVDRTRAGRKVLSDHVCDTALVGTVGILGSAAPWQAAISQFEELFDLSEVVAFEYQKDDEVMRPVGFGSSVTADRFRRLEVQCQEDRNVFTHAKVQKMAISTLDEEAANLESALQIQVQRILGAPALLVMPVVSEQVLLGIFVAGVNGAQLERFRMGAARVDYFLSKVGSQLEVCAALAKGGSEAAETRLQEYLLQTRQLVHEANNPLGVVANYLQILTLKFEQDPETRNQLDVLREEVHRVADILSSLREPPTRTRDQLTSVDINKLLEELISIFKVSLFEPNEIHCVLKLDRKAGEILSLPEHFKQVLTNLLKNSVEALETLGKGTITVETNDAVYFDGRHCVRVVVADDGPGIPANVMDHLFTSAVSTKAKPHSGLGLMVVKRLVEEMGGKILVYSSEQEGARFELLFPRG